MTTRESVSVNLLMISHKGWQKSVQLKQAITQIGSSPGSDIQLESARLAPTQLQIFYSQDTPANCKVLNLDSEIAVVVSGKEQKLGSYGSVDLHDDDQILLEGFHLRLQMPFSARVVSSSKFISASMLLTNARLEPGIPLLGRLTLKNTGDEHACQFQVDVKGLPAECYQIDPTPVLYPGAEEEVRVRFFHQSIAPAAGSLEITFEISAPGTYPDEQIIIRQRLSVSPVFNPLLEIQDDTSREVNRKVEFPARQRISEPAPKEEPRRILKSDSARRAGLTIIYPLPEIKPDVQVWRPATPPQGAKPVQSPPDSYWNETQDR